VDGGSEDVISVAELARRFRRAVEEIGGQWVEGEVSSLKRAGSGHVYFALKDEKEDACLDCVMYRFYAQRARRHLVEGARLQLLGKATVWAPRGRLQFVVEAVRPAGKGALLEALEQLKLRLAAEGLFAIERKRRLPAEPRVVGVVTSPTGAAFHDICSVAFRRGGARIVLSPARVQGERAAETLVRAIDLIERYPELDVLIVGRGGGSGEDLMAFNDERVVRRIAASRVPVVSAVGHEIDSSLTDLAADVRAATPSQAAELVIPDARARKEGLKRAAQHLGRAMHARLLVDAAALGRLRARLGDPRFLIAERQLHVDEFLLRLERQQGRMVVRRRSALEQLRRRLSARHPRSVFAGARAELGPLTARLSGAIRLRLGEGQQQLGERAARLEGLSPLAVLGRGYAIATRENGRAVRSAEEVEPGEPLGLRFHRGRVAVRVTAVEIGSDDPGHEGNR
jgi:exodeoxyribonuclease VII large subunit